MAEIGGSIFNNPNWLSDIQGLNGLAPSQSYGPMSMPDLIPSSVMPAAAPSLTGGFGAAAGLTSAAGGAPSVADNPWAQKLGANMGTANLALNGLQTIAGLWGAFKQASLAKRQFKETTRFNRANMANQVKAFNEQLDGRARSRAVVEGASATPGYYDRFKAEGMPADPKRRG